MYEIETELDFGIVEKRKYDDRDRLVEVRKVYPPQHISPKKLSVSHRFQPKD